MSRVYLEVVADQIKEEFPKYYASEIKHDPSSLNDERFVLFMYSADTTWKIYDDSDVGIYLGSAYMRRDIVKEIQRISELLHELFAWKRYYYGTTPPRHENADRYKTFREVPVDSGDGTS